MVRLLLPAVACLLVSLGYSTAFHTPFCHSRNLPPKQHSSNAQKFQGFKNEPSSSIYFTSLLSNVGNDPNEKKKRPINPIVLVKKVFATMLLQILRFPGKFKVMTRKAKLIFATQLLIVSMIFAPFIGYAVKSQNNYSTRPRPPIEIAYSQFQDLIEGSLKDGGQVVNLRVGPDKLTYQYMQPITDEQKAALKDYVQGKPIYNIDIPGRTAFTRKIPASPEFVDYLRRHKVGFTAAAVPTSSRLVGTAVRTLLVCCYAIFLLRMYRNMSGGGAGGSPGKLADMSQLPSATFDDIEGIDAAKFEVMELVDTLRNPGKYAILGARAPTGLLLEGPPGTGKTLLARATAATAGVPLIYCSGSDFVEMYVGRGAARVRKTFEKAQRIAPCIIFIDELDALGKARDTGMMANMRGNDEAEQTLNQLLACMDGLDSSKQICVLAATNRREVLDQALIRPGRFDRMVKLTLPNTAGREAILRVHAKKLPGFQECNGIDPKRPGSLGIGRKVDLSAVASATPGLSGAELEFIVNEAAIRAIRRVSADIREGKDASQIIPNVDPEDFENSVMSFFQTRRKGGMENVMKNVFG